MIETYPSFPVEDWYFDDWPSGTDSESMIAQEKFARYLDFTTGHALIAPVWKKARYKRGGARGIWYPTGYARGFMIVEAYFF